MSDRYKLAFILISMLFGMVFLAIDDEDTRMIYYALTGNKIHLQSWIWYNGEYIGIAILLFVISATATSYKWSFRTPIILKICDMVDFWLTGNQVWGRLDGFPISMNIISIAIFIAVVGTELLKEWKQLS